jgi:S1-C subfamily serine protease
VPLTDAELIAQLQNVIPDLGDVRDLLGADPAERLAELVRPRQRERPATRAIVGRGESEQVAQEAAWEVAAEGAVGALDKIGARGVDAELTPAERDGAEAIIELIGRPAIFIQDGNFLPPPPPWEHLEASRAEIQRSLISVGRIEVTGHPTLDWVGTGFLVSEDTVMTNRHVAKEFAMAGRDGAWQFEPDLETRIDFKEELGESPSGSAEFDLVEIIGVSSDFDLALLRAEPRKKQDLPPPLPLTSEFVVEPGREVYVIGYPAADSRRNDAEEMRRIFSGVYDIKRLQPGKVTGTLPKARRFKHDASTLGGNSGSAVIDLKTHVVVGLHFSGRYRKANLAFELARLADNPLLQQAGVSFA